MQFPFLLLLIVLLLAIGLTEPRLGLRTYLRIVAAVVVVAGLMLVTFTF
jgi:hypothetical protein